MIFARGNGRHPGCTGEHPVPPQANRFTLPLTVVASLLISAAGVGVAWGILGQRVDHVEDAAAKTETVAERHADRLGKVEQAVVGIQATLQAAEKRADERHGALLGAMTRRRGGDR